MQVLKSIKNVSVALLMVMLCGCESWLDLKPIDRVLEDQLYETEEGFKQSLTGGVRGVKSKNFIWRGFDV